MDYSFQKQHPVQLKIWHWLNSIAVTGLFLTVLLRKTLLSGRKNAAIIETKANEAGVQISSKVAKDIAREFTGNLWNWHVYLGIALSIFLILRLWAYFVSRKDTVICPWAHFKNLKNVPASEKKQAIHCTLVRASYAVFYVAIGYMCLSGLAMHYENALGLSESVSETLGEIHENVMWIILAFGAAHILGVIKAENSGDYGIVSNLIGKK